MRRRGFEDGADEADVLFLETLKIGFSRPKVHKKTTASPVHCKRTSSKKKRMSSMNKPAKPLILPCCRWIICKSTATAVGTFATAFSPLGRLSCMRFPLPVQQYSLKGRQTGAKGQQCLSPPAPSGNKIGTQNSPSFAAVLKKSCRGRKANSCCSYAEPKPFTRKTAWHNDAMNRLFQATNSCRIAE